MTPRQTSTCRVSALLAASTLAMMMALGLVAALADHLQQRMEADAACAREMRGM